MVNLSYDSVSDETRVFLNKAMDIYAVLESKDLNKEVTNSDEEKHEYHFLKRDKKILALFIAAFLADTPLKDMLEEYDDLSLDSILKYVDLKNVDIPSLPDNEYEEYFNRHFKYDVLDIINKKNYKHEINTITPELIVERIGREEVLANYGFSCGLLKKFYNHFIGDLSFFGALERLIEAENIVSEKKDDENSGGKKVVARTPRTKNIIQYNDKLWKILENVKAKFVGQEEYVEKIFYTILTNQKLAAKENVPDGERFIVFVDGPTGTGKTSIVREITKLLGIPFSASSATDYSATGYVGGDFDDILKKLLEKANGDIELAERGIVVLDEITKIAIQKNDKDLVMKKAVQHKLLNFTGGGVYSIKYGDNPFDRSKVDFSTSRLTFIFLGALTDLRDKKMFLSDDTEDEFSYQVSVQALIDLGFEKELAGRFNTFLNTEEYNIDDLKKIIASSELSPLIGLKKLVEDFEKKLVYDDSLIELMARKAFEMDTGVRAIQSLVQCLKINLLKELFRGNSKEIFLDANFVSEVFERMVSRKGYNRHAV